MEEPKFINLFRQQPRFEHDTHQQDAYLQAQELELKVREIIREELDRQAQHAMRNR